jgi:hypothetical protein
MGKNSEENLEKVRLLVFLGNESLHGIVPSVVVKLVDVHKGLIRLPTVTGDTETSPADFELHGRSSVATSAVTDD